MIIPAKPIIEPSERSNSPAIINMQAPMAMMPSWADTSIQLTMPLAENMPVSAATSPKNTNTRTVPARAPSSGRPKTRFNAFSPRTLSSGCGGVTPVAAASSNDFVMSPYPRDCSSRFVVPKEGGSESWCLPIHPLFAVLSARFRLVPRLGRCCPWSRSPDRTARRRRAAGRNGHAGPGPRQGGIPAGTAAGRWRKQWRRI